ncbi:MAG: MFS transporter [Caldilineaceae bacterium]|nr:MFS transporter [Caldilineaceae bacterium]
MTQATTARVQRRDNANLISAGYFAAFISLGLVAASLGPTLNNLGEQTAVGVAQLSLIYPSRSGGYFIGSLLGGRLYDRVAGHMLLAAMLVVMALCMALVPTLGIFWLLAGVLLITGIAEAIVDVGGNAMIGWVHGVKVGPYMNALHFFFGVGALISPIIVGLALRYTDGIAWAYWILAVLLLPPALWIVRFTSPTTPARRAVGEAPAAPLDLVLVGLAVLFMMFVVGAEVSFSGWVATYAVSLNLATRETAAYLTSVFWGALTFGRLLSIPIAMRYRPRTILLADVLGCIAGVALIVAAPASGTALWIGAAILGLFMASVFPTVLSWAGRHMTMSGTVTSWFLVGASLGAITLPWIIGRLIAAFGPEAAMIAILVDLVVLLGLYFLLMLKGGEPNVHTPAES